LGAANEKLECMPARRQARAMTPDQVRQLEVFTADPEQPFLERQITFIFLVLTALRSRFSDLKKFTSHLVSDDLLEFIPRQTKTSRLDKSRLPLCMVGPIKLFSAADWFTVHTEARILRGIPLGEWELAAAHSKMVFTNLACKVSDYSSALRRTLAILQFEDASVFSAHSAKATMLTFAANCGMTAEERGLLGYHRPTGVSSSVRSYDRSKQIAPVEKLARHLTDFRDNAPNLAGEDKSGDISCSDSDSSSSDSGEELESPATNAGPILNEARGTLHSARADDLTRTRCGLVLRAHYRELDCEGSWAKCNRGCFKVEFAGTAADSDSS
jgi:hypothetical protein